MAAPAGGALYCPPEVSDDTYYDDGRVLKIDGGAVGLLAGAVGEDFRGPSCAGAATAAAAYFVYGGHAEDWNRGLVVKVAFDDDAVTLVEFENSYSSTWSWPAYGACAALPGAVYCGPLGARDVLKISLVDDAVSTLGPPDGTSFGTGTQGAYSFNSCFASGDAVYCVVWKSKFRGTF